MIAIIRYIFKDTKINVNIYCNQIVTQNSIDIPQILKRNHFNPISGHSGFHRRIIESNRIVNG